MMQRKRNRKKGYDYSTPGAYFITICIKHRNEQFENVLHENRISLGEITNNKMVLNKYGKIVQHCWNDLSNHYKNIELDEYVVMPDHFHGIICLGIDNHGLPEIVRGFKTFSSRRINEGNPPSRFQWQKSYYDRIIRDDNELERIRIYIKNNPVSQHANTIES